MRLVCLCLLLVAAGLGGCGSDDGKSVKDICTSAMTKLCDKACACTQGATCDLTAGLGSLFEFEDMDDCTCFYAVLGCDQAELPPVNFFEGCSTALDSASCDPTAGDGIGALQVPDLCIYSE
jgi:hypothetical protein